MMLRQQVTTGTAKVLMASSLFAVQLRLETYYYYHSLYGEKMPIRPASCSMLRLHHYAQNCAGIMYVTLASKPSTSDAGVQSSILMGA